MLRTELVEAMGSVFFGWRTSVCDDVNFLLKESYLEKPVLFGRI